VNSNNGHKANSNRVAGLQATMGIIGQLKSFSQDRKSCKWQLAAQEVDMVGMVVIHTYTIYITKYAMQPSAIFPLTFMVSSY